MGSVPEYINEIEQQLRAAGGTRQESGDIGWTVQKDYMYRIQDEQADTRGARTGDVYRTTDGDASLAYIGTAFYLDLDGDPLDPMDGQYGVWFDVIQGMPHVQVDTDLQYWDPDPIYDAIENILDTHDLPVAYAPPEPRPESDSTAQAD